MMKKLSFLVVMLMTMIFIGGNVSFAYAGGSWSIEDNNSIQAREYGGICQTCLRINNTFKLQLQKISFI